MTNELGLGAIGQISRQVSDIAQAVAWYRDVLGLRHLFTAGGLAFFDCDGTRLFLSRPESGAAPADESVIYFKTADINRAYNILKGRGVIFRREPHLIHRHESGMEEWMAFFDDPEGRPLALMAQVPNAAAVAAASVAPAQEQ